MKETFYGVAGELFRLVQDAADEETFFRALIVVLREIHARVARSPGGVSWTFSHVPREIATQVSKVAQEAQILADMLSRRTHQSWPKPEGAG